MTFITTILLIVGGLCIISAIECQSLVGTFTSIMSGQAIDWTNSGGCGSKLNQGGTEPQPTGKCTNGQISPQAGWICMNGSWVQIKVSA